METAMRTLAMVLLALVATAQETQTAPLSGTSLINQHIKAKWDEAGLKAAKRSDDAEFVRRVYLDIVGVIPSLEEAQKFLDDKAMSKRRQLIEALCKDERYAKHWGDVWSGVIVGFDNDQRDQGVRLKATEDIHAMLAKNVPHDEFARRVITVKGSTTERPGMSKEMEENKIEDVGLAGYVYNIQREAGKDFPLALVGKLTRSFMGVQIQCAQCHDHPFDKWTQEEFYGMASFFGNVTARRQAFDEKAMMEYMKAQRAEAKPGEKKPAEPMKRPEYYVVVGDRDGERTAAAARPGRRMPGGGGDLSIPDGKGGPVKASFLVTGQGAVAGEARRATFAKYMTSPDNLQFAKMQVNRVWAHFFGAGIVNPVDDFNAKNKATHPELLDGLAKDFIAHKYDNHWLIQAIAGSDAYQLTSKSTSKERDPATEKWFAIQRVRSLSPEQILRSLMEATNLGDAPTARAGRDRKAMPGGGLDGRERALFGLLNQFRSNFGDDEGNEIVDFAGTIPSALLMMNSPVVGTATSSQRFGALGELLNKHATPEARIKAIYLSTLTRTPSDKELSRWKAHVTKSSLTSGYEDLIWTLLNTSEFLFNH
ncbi:MAG TPA: DUF1549 and DUF1553 domain-containing protein [Planctomycetota bacterium]